MSQLAFIQNLPQVVRQPPVIAAIASLGLHGLIAMSFPQFTLGNQEEQAQKPRGTVGVIGLSPTEQSRIPQLGAGNNTIPPLGTQTLPPIPGIPTDLPPPPANIPPLIDNQPGYNYPVSPTPNQSQPRRSRIRQDILSIPGQGRRMNNEETVSVGPISGNRRLPPPRINIQTNADQTNRGNRNNTPRYNYRVDGRTRISSTLPSGVNPGNFTIEGENFNNPNEGGNSNTPSPEPIDQETAYNPDGTSTDAYRSRLAGWAAGTGKVPNKSQEISLNLPLPSEVCDLGITRATAIFGTLVDGQGKLSGQPELLQPSGYAILNRKALETVRSQNYPASGSEQPFVVQVAFNRQGSSCPALPTRTVQNDPNPRNSGVPGTVRPPVINPSSTPTPPANPPENNNSTTPRTVRPPVINPSSAPTPPANPPENNNSTTPRTVRPPVIVPSTAPNASPPPRDTAPASATPSPRPSPVESATPSPSPQGESPSPSPSPQDTTADPEAPRGSAADLR